MTQRTIRRARPTGGDHARAELAPDGGPPVPPRETGRPSPAGERFLGPLICFVLGASLVLAGIRGSDDPRPPARVDAPAAQGPRNAGPEPGVPTPASEGIPGQDRIYVEFEDDWVFRPDRRDGFVVHRLETGSPRPLELRTADDAERSDAVPGASRPSCGSEIPRPGARPSARPHSPANSPASAPAVELLDRLAALFERLDLAGIESEVVPVAPMHRNLEETSATGVPATSVQVGKTSG